MRLPWLGDKSQCRIARSILGGNITLKAILHPKGQRKYTDNGVSGTTWQSH